MKVHEKQQMTVTISKNKKRVTFTNQEFAEIDVNRMDDIGRVIDTITYRGKIVGRGQFGKDLRVQAANGNTLSFNLDNVADIRQGDAMTKEDTSK